MQTSTTVSHQGVHCSLPKEKFDSFIAIGEEELSKLVKSSKSTTSKGVIYLRFCHVRRRLLPTHMAPFSVNRRRTELYFSESKDRPCLHDRK